ncbi:MAG TPA: O-antigen ligase family protein [Thermoanaerobaculia bacterium]|jgi:O-antigen ligase
MAKTRGAQSAGQRRAAAPAAPRRGKSLAAPHLLLATPRGAVFVAAILAVVLAGTSLAVDTSAAAAFDAPKRAIALVGTALAAAAALFVARRAFTRARWTALSSLRRAALVLAAAALAGAVLSALASPRRALSLDAMRSVILMAALLPLGASDAVARGRAWLTGVFLSACAVNAAVSILQGLGVYHPFALETAGSRQDTGAFAGNVGYLAIALALASVAALGILLSGKGRPARFLAGAAFALFAADLLVNRNLTALSAALAGIAALLLARFRRRAVFPLLGALLAAGLLVAAYPPLRERARTDWVLIRAGDWNALVSYRGGPWAAAVAMARERPLAGFGPGTFPAEYVPHRLSAEIRARRRFLSPMLTSSYGEAHNDYLQAASDAGIPVALLVLAAAGCLLAASARAARVRESRDDPEPALLLAVLVAGAVAALTWFPVQRPITAVPLLLAAGRAWRVSGEREPVPAPGQADA